MRDDIEPLLSRLPEPAPPSSLAAGVMARIAREPDRATVAGTLRSAAPDRGERRAWLGRCWGSPSSPACSRTGGRATASSRA